MHLVYRLIFTKRKQKNIMPFLYIGSKSNAIFENGMILSEKRKDPYYGSSSYDDYSEIVKSDEIDVEILKTFNNYTDALNFESLVQKSLDVVADPRYFNLGIATVNNFSNPDYATYKHVVTGKTVRLPRNHIMVLSGDYVGVSKGTTLSKEVRKRIGRSGKENPFYGKKHTEETKRLISETNKGKKVSDERREWFVENVAKKEKSPEHRRKIGEKGRDMIMLKNKNTGKTVRIHKSEKEKYDPNEWVNPYILSKNKSTGSRWITNGIENRKIKKDEEPQQGFWFGRTKPFSNHKKERTCE